MKYNGITNLKISGCILLHFYSTVRPWDARFGGNKKPRVAQIRATWFT